MQAVTSPTALEMSSEAKKAVAPAGFVHSTLDRKDEYEELRD